MTQTVAPLAVGRTREQIAERLAHDLVDGYVVNLGVGIPLEVPRFIPPDVEVVLHAENGVLGIGPSPDDGGDPDLTDAGKQPITLISGAAITDSAMSFAMIRGGHLDVTVLGALQVAANGDLANWYVPGKNPAVGGAMDLVAGTPQVWVAMEHVDRKGNLRFRLSARNFNPLAGMSGRRTFAEVEHLVPVDELHPDDIHLPGVFVDDVVVAPGSLADREGAMVDEDEAHQTITLQMTESSSR